MSQKSISPNGKKTNFAEPVTTEFSVKNNRSYAAYWLPAFNIGEKMETGLATVVIESQFARANLSMAELFAKRLQDVFSENKGRITVKSFGTREDYFSGVMEKIEFTLHDGRTVCCEITTPKEKR